MKTYDVIFIHPPRAIKPDYGKYLKFARQIFMFIPMGVFSIADLLDREGFGVKMINYPLEMHFNRNWSLESNLKQIDFQVCAMDYHWVLNTHGVLEVAKIVKSLNPNAKVILGGFSASHYHKQLLKYYDTIDGVIRGEGEIPLLKYVQNVTKGSDLSSVPNLSYRDSSNHKKINPITYIAKTLDDLNFTNVSLLQNADMYFKRSRQVMGIGFNVPNGRGCPFNCPCCGGGQRAQQQLCGRTEVILRSPEKITQDLHEVLNKYKLDCIFFGHGTYPATFKYWKTLFQLMRKEKFDIGGDLEIWRLPFPREMWNLYYKTFRRRRSSISISPRTISSRVQRKVAEICDPTFSFPKNQIQDLIKNANSYRLALRIWLTLGFPFQTWSDLLEDYVFSMKTVFKNAGSNYRPITIMNEPFYISPGSPAHLNPEKFDIKLKYDTIPQIANEFKRTKVTFANRVLNYDSKHFSRAFIRIANLAFFMSTMPTFFTAESNK